MCNPEKTIWIVHNGEVYNFLEIRSELQQLGHILRTEIKQDFSVLDLGANIGYYALLERSLVGQ